MKIKLRCTSLSRATLLLPLHPPAVLFLPAQLVPAARLTRTQMNVADVLGTVPWGLQGLPATRNALMGSGDAIYSRRKMCAASSRQRIMPPAGEGQQPLHADSGAEQRLPPHAPAGRRCDAAAA